MTGLYAWNDKVFISKSPVLDGTENWWAAYSFGNEPVPAGGSYWRTNALMLPIVESGDYFLIFSVNADQSLAETTFTNNTLAVPLSFHLTPPDLAPVAFQAPAVVDGPPNPAVTLVWGVTNRGPGQAGPYAFGWYDTVYVSTNSGLSGVIAYAQQYRENDSLPAGGSYWRTNTVELPLIADGSYYLVFETDYGNYLGESNLSNNVISVPVTFHTSLPELASVVLQAPTEVTGPPRPLLNLVWGVTNRAVSTAKSDYGWYDAVYLSTNAFLDDSAVWVWSAQETNSVPAGGSYWRTNAVRSPVVQSGTYYLLFVANISRYPEESDYDNNVAVAPVTFTIQPIDLAPIAWLVPSSVSGSPWPSVTVVAGVTNQGTGSVPGEMGWQDGVFLSTTPFLDDSAYPFAIWSRTNTLPPGGAYWMTNTIRLQVVDSATCTDLQDRRG